MSTGPEPVLDLDEHTRPVPGGRNGAALRGVVAVALIVAAYHHSLETLGAYVSSDTPLAYLGLVPLLALGLALAKARPRPGEPRLPDRQVDWIIGIPLLAIAFFLSVVLPDRLSYTFWTKRFDLLGLPFFAAGVVALLFGSRVLYRIRLPIAFLLLAWPFPYERVVSRLLALSSWFALWGVKRGLPLVGGAEAVSGSIFTIGDGARAFTVNVAPTCVGANSIIGFLLVGGAATLFLRGPRARKLAWLAVGVVLLSVLNLGRLLFLFWAGSRFGEHATMSWLHPYAGLALFVVGCLAMILLLPLFGLSTRSPAGEAGPSGPVRVSSPPAVRSALALLLALAVVVGVANGRLERFDPFGGLAVRATSWSALDSRVSVPGWSRTEYDEIGWAKQFFGPTSRWVRYVYQGQGTSLGGRSFFMDVQSVTDVSKFSTYGLEACYRFHNFRIEDSRWVNVGGPAKAQAVTYVDRSTDQAWTIVAWVSPVTSGADATKRFERTVLLASVRTSGQWKQEGDASQAALVSFARSFVAAAHAASPGQRS